MWGQARPAAKSPRRAKEQSGPGAGATHTLTHTHKGGTTKGAAPRLFASQTRVGHQKVTRSPISRTQNGITLVSLWLRAGGPKIWVKEEEMQSY